MVMDMATATVMARKPKYSVVFPPVTLLALAMGLAYPAYAAEWKITPSITATETATDNVALSSTSRQSDLVTDISPAIHISGSGGRVKLNLDYQLHNLFYARDSDRNQTQNSLNAMGTLEAIEDWFFIDASGTISQQGISPFLGGSNSSSVNVNTDNNTTETSTYRVSPYFRGTLGGFADYLLRYNLATTKAQASDAYDSDSREVVFKLKGVTTLASLGWSIDANRLNTKNGNGLSNESDTLRGVLTYHFSPQFRGNIIAGREANDYLSESKESHTIKGAGVEWTPTARTSLAASRESRFFGNSNKIDFTHRTAGTAWKYSESKGATTQPNQSTLGVGTNYDLFFNLYASAIPDPVARAAYVNALLLSNGISPNAQSQGGYLTSGVTLQHQRTLSFAITGVTNTVTFAATQSKTNNLSKVIGSGLLIGQDQSLFQSVKQRGLSVNWSHKVTPNATLVGMVSHLKSQGSGSNSAESTQKTFNLNFLVQLSPQTTASLGARRVVKDGTSSYKENALTATLSHQF